jgi:RNA 2',3'-cyclic 3'-phosphodiesterase
MRTFIAIDTPDHIKREMTKVQSELRRSAADVRWETSDKFHITLKFLGETKETMVDDIIENIQALCSKFSPFALQYDRVGCFPNMKNPRVIWIGCRDISQNLSKIKIMLDKELKQFGIESEERAFHPHITLGRVKSEREIKNLIPIIENLTFKSEVIECGQILIMKSILKPSGSVYSTLKSIILK